MSPLPLEKYSPVFLGEYIDSFEYYDFHSLKLNELQTILPLGTVQIIFQLNTEVCHKTAFSNGWKDRPDSFIGGPFDKGYLMKVSPSSKIFVIILKPGTARYFMKIPVSELRNRLVNPIDIWGKDGIHWLEKINTAGSNAERVRISENFLLKRLSGLNTSPVQNCVSKIISQSGFCRISDLAGHCNLSISYFRKKFTEEVGLSPKQFQKIIRINILSK